MPVHQHLIRWRYFYKLGCLILLRSPLIMCSVSIWTLMTAEHLALSFLDTYYQYKLHIAVDTCLKCDCWWEWQVRALLLLWPFERDKALLNWMGYITLHFSDPVLLVQCRLLWCQGMPVKLKIKFILNKLQLFLSNVTWGKIGHKILFNFSFKKWFLPKQFKIKKTQRKG